MVLGDTDLADAIRTRVTAKGGTLDGIPDAVIDASEDVLKSFGLAQSLDSADPKTGSPLHTPVPSPVSELHGRNAGARARDSRRPSAASGQRLSLAGRQRDAGWTSRRRRLLVVEELGAQDGSVEIL